MKNRLKIVVFIIVVAVILIFSGLIIYFSLNSKNNNKNNDSNQIEQINTINEMRNYIETLNNAIINGTSKDNLIKVLKTDKFDESLIMTGEDAYIVSSPSPEIVKEYDLEKYISTAKNLEENLAIKVKENFTYEITDVGEMPDYTSFHITYRSFYYDSYIKDLFAIRNELLIRAGYDLENVVNNAQFIADLYKAKVKAAYMLNNYIDNYVNQNETASTILSFTNNKISDSAEEFISYFLNLTGGNYNQSALLTAEEELNAFLNNFDLTDPLAL